MALTAERLPYTCLWSRVGDHNRDSGVRSWQCEHPNRPTAGPLQPGECDGCPFWEAFQRVDTRPASASPDRAG